MQYSAQKSLRTHDLSAMKMLVENGLITNDALPALERMLKDPDVKREGLAVLEKLVTPDDLPTFKEMMNNPNLDTSKAMQWLLEKLINSDNQSKIKLMKLVDRWSRPIDKYNLKLWIQNSNNKYAHPSIGIGLGTKNKPNIFTFVILDNDSINWLETALIESIKAFSKIRKSINNSPNNSILWLKKKELDKLRKIGILIFITKDGDNTVIRLMINSKASLYADLNLDDINWILETLNMAKYTLDGVFMNG